jgi:hypothetical protein
VHGGAGGCYTQLQIRNYELRIVKTKKLSFAIVLLGLGVSNLQSQDISVELNEKIEIVYRESAANATYQWLENGQPIPGATGASYCLPYGKGAPGYYTYVRQSTVPSGGTERTPPVVVKAGTPLPFHARSNRVIMLSESDLRMSDYIRYQPSSTECNSAASTYIYVNGNFYYNLSCAQQILPTVCPAPWNASLRYPLVEHLALLDPLSYVYGDTVMGSENKYVLYAYGYEEVSCAGYQTRAVAPTKCPRTTSNHFYPLVCLSKKN